MPVETHLVVSKSAQLTRAYETEISMDALKSLAHVYHRCNDIAAPIASGSFKNHGYDHRALFDESLAEIAHGIAGNLLTRAADVVLKERRKLVLMRARRRCILFICKIW